MIWVRRFFILPVGAVFLVLLAFTLLGARAGATLYNPDFYKRLLAEHDVYGFVLGDLSAAAVDELRNDPLDFVSESQEYYPIEALELPTEEVVGAVNRAFPPEWVQDQAEGVIDQVGGYLNGEQDDFEVRIAINERVPDAARELKSIVGSSSLHAVVLEHYVAPEVDKALEQGALPLDVSLDRDDVVAALGRSVPEEWVQEHVNRSIDEAAAYMSSRQDTMEIHVPLYERADAAIAELNALYAGPDLADALFEEAIAPGLEAELPPTIELAFDVSITEAEVLEAIESGLSGQWLYEQAEAVVARVSPYLVGRTDDFRADIHTAAIRAPALASLESLVWRKLEDRLAELPACTSGELPFLTRAPESNELPRCMPLGVGADGLLDMLNVDVTGEVERQVGGRIPGVVVYTEADMLSAMGGEGSQGVETIDRVRELFSEGWTYTELDLQEDWGGDEGDGVENLRSIVSDGWRITLDDVNELEPDAMEQLRSFPAGSAGLTMVLVLVLAALLAAAGALGGQTWRGRLAWASGTLAVTSLLLFLVATMSAGPVLTSSIVELKADAAEELGSPTAVLGLEKALDVAQSIGDDFVGGFAHSSLWLFVVGAVAFGLTFVPKEFISRFRRPREGSYPPAPQ